MNVLKLFNGMSVGSMALEDAGIAVDKVYISEIDKYANKASEVLFPNSIQLGSVLDWREWDIDWSSIDLVTGGFPCQAWSMAGKQLGDKDERGMLFWTMLDIMKQVRHYNPKADFLIENVRMKKEFEEYITTHTENALGEVHKILINSALVSAQNRNRYYWTSFPVSQPEDEGIVLADILEFNPEEVTVMSDKFTTRNAHILRDDVNGKAKNLSAMEYVKNGRQGDYIKCGVDEKYFYTSEQLKSISECAARNGDIKIIAHKEGYRRNSQIFSPEGKTEVLDTCQGGGRVIGTVDSGRYRKLTPRECMRLQTIPEHYIDKLLGAGISNTQLYKMTGNAWTMKVISHILKCMINQTQQQAPYSIYN